MKKKYTVNYKNYYLKVVIPFQVTKDGRKFYLRTLIGKN